MRRRDEDEVVNRDDAEVGGHPPRPACSAKRSGSPQPALFDVIAGHFAHYGFYHSSEIDGMDSVRVCLVPCELRDDDLRT